MFIFAYECSNCGTVLYMKTDRCRSTMCVCCRKLTLKRNPEKDRTKDIKPKLKEEEYGTVNDGYLIE